MIAASTKILVGITTHNRASVLPQAIASALSQENVDVVVAVHDDASTDSTPSVRVDFPTVEWTRSEKMQGYRAIRNRWMQRQEFDYFISLDDDAWFLRPDAISLGLKRFLDNPRLGAIAFDILSPDQPDERPVSAPKETFMFIGCGHMLRQSAVHEAGYYVDTPGAYGGEERDLALRLIDHQYQIELLPGIHVWHDKTLLSRDLLSTHTSGVCNELSLALHRCPQPDLWWVLPGKLFNFIRFWLRKPEYRQAGFAGLGLFTRNFAKSWKQRSPVRRESFHRARGRRA